MAAQVLFVKDLDGASPYASYLRDSGLQSNVVSTPEAAFIAITSNAPDVVVTDIAFFDSDIDGFAFIRELRSIVDDTTSIIVLSRYVRQEDRERARKAGADLYLLQPALPSAVLFEVKRALILKRSWRRLSWNWPRPLIIPPSIEFDRRRHV